MCEATALKDGVAAGQFQGVVCVIIPCQFPPSPHIILMTDLETAKKNYGEGARLLQDGQFDMALPYLSAAADAYPTAQTMTALTWALMQLGDYARALPCFQIMDEKEWHSARTLTLFSQAYEGTAQFDNAIKTYSRAIDLNPVFGPALRRYCDLMWPRDPDEVLHRLDIAFAQIDAETPDSIEMLKYVATYHERMARRAAGKSDLFGETLQDLSFTFAQDKRDRALEIAEAVRAREPDHRGAVSLLASYALRDQRWKDVAALLKDVENAPHHHAEHMVWMDAPRAKRLDALTPDDVFTTFAPCEILVALPPSQDGTVFLSSTPDYFAQFTAPFLLSLEAFGVPARVHVHIVNATGPDLDVAHRFLKNLAGLEAGLSSELAANLDQHNVSVRNYAHAIRYIRADQILGDSGGPVCMTDVDALVNRSPQDIFERTRGGDLGLWAVPGVWRTNSHFCAALSVFNPTDLGRRFLRRIAAYIADAFHRSEFFWGLDQNALYVVYDEMLRAGHEPHITCVDDSLLSLSCDPDAVIWGGSGKEKFELVRRLIAGDIDKAALADDPYAARFVPYFEQAQQAFR